MIDTYIKFFKAHEKILIGVLASFLIYGCVANINDRIASRDNLNFKASVIKTQQDATVNAAVAQQYAADAAKMQEMQAASDAKQTALNNQIVAMATALLQQQKKDAVMTPTELTDRWNILVPTADASITNGQVTLPEAGAVATVQQLEVVPEQAKKIDALNQKYDLESGLLVQSQKTNADLITQVTGLKTTLVDNNTRCESDKKIIKDAARKSKWHYFAGGAVTTLIALAKFGLL
jgi:hypothetical protein